MHTRFRRLLQPYFHRSRIAALEPTVRDLVNEMLEPLLAAGGGDIAPALTYPLPAHALKPLREWDGKDFGRYAAD